MRRIIYVLLIVAFLFVPATALFAVSEASAEDFVIIVNKQGPFAGGVEMKTVKSVFLGDRKFSDGTRLIPVNFTEGELKDSFLKNVLHMDSKGYRLHWVKKVFREGVDTPKTLSNSYEVVEFVKREKGAVAYIPANTGKVVLGVVIIRP